MGVFFGSDVGLSIEALHFRMTSTSQNGASDTSQPHDDKFCMTKYLDSLDSVLIGVKLVKMITIYWIFLI